MLYLREEIGVGATAVYERDVFSLYDVGLDDMATDELSAA